MNRYLVRIAVIVAAVAATACSDQLTAPRAAPPAPQLVALKVGLKHITTPRTPAFSLPIDPAALAGALVFEQPLSNGGGNSDAGNRDATLLSLLTIKVCVASDANCAQPLDVLTSAGGDDALRLRDDGSYKGTWKPSKDLARGTQLRIVVDVGGLVVGSMTQTHKPGSIPIMLHIKNNAVIRTRAMHAREASATAVAEALVQEFSLDETQVAVRLFSDPAPYTAPDVGAALRNSPTDQDLNQTTVVFHDLGVPADQMAKTLMVSFAADNGDQPEVGAEAMNDAGFSLNDYAPTLHEIYGLADIGVTTVLDGIGIGATPIGMLLKDYFNANDVYAATIFHAMGIEAPTVMDVLRVAYGDQISLAAHALQIASYGVRQVADAIEKAGIPGGKEMATMLRGIGYVQTEIAEALLWVDDLPMKGAMALMKEIGFTPEDVAKGMKVAYGATADAFVVAGKELNWTANEVGNGVKQGYEITAQATAVALKNVGYAANEVAGAMTSAYGFTADQAAVALKAAGYTADQIASGLTTAYGFTASQVATAMKFAGFAANEVGAALNSALGLTATAAAQALQAANYAVGEIASTLRTTFNQTVEGASNILRGALGVTESAVQSVLEGAGYAAGEVADFFEDLGSTIAGGFCGFFGC